MEISRMSSWEQGRRMPARTHHPHCVHWALGVCIPFAENYSLFCHFIFIEHVNASI